MIIFFVLNEITLLKKDSLTEFLSLANCNLIVAEAVTEVVRSSWTHSPTPVSTSQSETKQTIKFQVIKVIVLK